MPKYSTGNSGGESDGTCELCGEPATTLRDATVAGAQLAVCPECAPHDEAGRTQRAERQQQSAETQADALDQTDSPTAQTGTHDAAAQGTSPLWDSDTSHWEEDGVSYDSDRLPYLVSDYGTRVQNAREAAGLTRDEVATALEISTQDVLVIEQGDAASTGIPGSMITALEDYFDITLTQ